MTDINNDSPLLHLASGYTVIDITNTGDVSHTISTERNQQRNWETLCQVLGLRAQLITISKPEILTLDTKTTRFGKNISGKQSVWTFTFGVEHEAVFASNTGPFGGLEADFVNVPVILQLNETAKITTPMFVVNGPDTNIYFEPR